MNHPVSNHQSRELQSNEPSVVEAEDATAAERIEELSIELLEAVSAIMGMQASGLFSFSDQERVIIEVTDSQVFVFFGENMFGDGLCRIVVTDMAPSEQDLELEDEASSIERSTPFIEEVTDSEEALPNSAEAATIPLIMPEPVLAAS